MTDYNEKINSLIKHNDYLKEKISNSKELFIRKTYKTIIKNNNRMICYYKNKMKD